MTKLGLVKSLLPLFFLFFILPNVDYAVFSGIAYHVNASSSIVFQPETHSASITILASNARENQGYDDRVIHPGYNYWVNFSWYNVSTLNWFRSQDFQFSCYGGPNNLDFCVANLVITNITAFGCNEPLAKHHVIADGVSAPFKCINVFGPIWSPLGTYRLLLDNGTGRGSSGLDLSAGAYNRILCAPNVINDSGFYFFNRDNEDCLACADGEVKCDDRGNELVCISNEWVIRVPCINGGWERCGLENDDSCPGINAFELLVANKERQIDRISITDQYGRNLQSSEMDNGTVYYSMFETQKIHEIAFRLLSNWTHKDWIIKPTDTVSVELLWNVTEALCIKETGVTGSSGVMSYYYDQAKYNCSLMDGYLSSNMTVQVNATLTSEGGMVLANPVISRSFTVELVEDSALLDNFQIVWLNETTGAVSGHIIRLSDLVDIQESKNPFAYVDAGFYSKYNSIYISGFSSGQLNATDLNYLYWEFDASTINPNDVFFANVTVGADGFANSSYSEVYGKVAEQRILYFKCWNDPRNTSILNSEKLNTSPVSFVCSYQLADTSGVSMAELVTNTTVEKMSDLGFGIGANEDYIDIITGREYRPAIWYSVPYSSSSGYVLTYRLNETSYRYRDTLGTPQEITPSRYVGEWGKLDNSLFPGVMTHVDLYVDTTDFERFILFEPSFDQVTYYENDTAVFIAMYYDPDNLVRDWSFRIYTDSSHSYALDYRDTQPGGACYFNSSGCIGYEILPIGMGVTELRFWVAGVQSCKRVSNVSGLCTGGYNYKFLDGKEKGTLYGTLTVYKASDYMSEESQTAEATLIVSKTGDLLGSLTKGWPWWLWLIVIILGLIAILILIKMATK